MTSKAKIISEQEVKEKLASGEYIETDNQIYIKKSYKKNTEVKKMKLYVACRQTGEFIEEVKTYEEGEKLISEYEAQDKKEGVYEADFYDIVNENREPEELWDDGTRLNMHVIKPFRIPDERKNK